MRSTRVLFSAALLLLGACAPRVTPPEPAPAPVGLPPIPEVDGALEIRVVHPTPSMPQPRVDSTYVYGSVGTGRATLTINGTPVPVAPNGAFLAYLPVPADGSYRLQAEARGRVVEATRAYRTPARDTAAARPATRPALVEYPQPRLAVVTGGADTVATGSDVAIGRTTPTGTYRYFLPRGARLAVTGEQADLLRVRLDSGTVAWVPRNALELRTEPPTAATLGTPRLQTGTAWTDVRIPAGGAAFQVEASDTALLVTVFARAAAPTQLDAAADPLVAGASLGPAGPGSSRLQLRLRRPIWGYKAFYAADGELVLRLRHPPRLDPMDPLRGLRVVVDPGHPPAGATGPTGLTEAEANLAIGLRLADLLRARGAEVVLTRTANTPVSLTARVDTAVRSDAHLLVSVHNNAFGEGVNPFRNHGTSTYHFHPFSAALARALNAEIVQTTRIPDLGARVGNLALVRPTWMPSALTESLYMLIPEQEAALRDPAFLDRLAAAHLQGIERFLRERLSQGVR